MDLTPLREKLRSRRRELGLTQEDLADRASQFSDQVFALHQIHHLERSGAQRMPDPDLIRPVALALDLEMMDLLQLVGYLD